MAKSFLLTSEQSGQVIVEQLHINLWFFDYSKVFFDIGLLLNVSKTLLKHSNLELSCYTLFSIQKNSVQDLYGELHDEETLQLVFNDEMARKTNASCIPGSNTAYVMRFRSGRSFLLLRPNLELEKNKNIIRVSIDTGDLDQQILESEFENTDCVEAYIRFRHQIDTKSTSNMYFEKRAFHDYVHFDFRFNEPRLFDTDESNAYFKMVSIRNILVFIIQPMRYRISLDSSRSMQYVRLLEKDEDGWKEYIEELKRRKGNFLVYHWESALPESAGTYGKDFNMLVSFEAEKTDAAKKLNVALVIGLMSCMFLLLPQYIDISQLIGKLGPHVGKISQSIGGVGLAIGLGVASEAVWSYLQRFLGEKR